MVNIILGPQWNRIIADGGDGGCGGVDGGGGDCGGIDSGGDCDCSIDRVGGGGGGVIIGGYVWVGCSADSSGCCGRSVVSGGGGSVDVVVVFVENYWNNLNKFKIINTTGAIGISVSEFYSGWLSHVIDGWGVGGAEVREWISGES